MEQNENKDNVSCPKVEDSTLNQTTVVQPEFVNIKMEIEVEDAYNPYNVIIKEEYDPDLHEAYTPNNYLPCVKQEQTDCAQNGPICELIIKQEELPIEYDGNNAAKNSMSPLCQRLHPCSNGLGKRSTILRRRERQQRYRERKREIIRERNRIYYLQRRRAVNCQTVSESGFDNAAEDEMLNDPEDIKKKLRRERDRRYREEHRETLKQRSKDYRRSKKYAQKDSGGIQDPNGPLEGREEPPL